MKNEKFTQRFNDLINEKGLRQIEISKATGLRKDLINKYVKGKMIPGNIPLYKLAKFLNVSPLYLLGISDKKESEVNYLYEDIVKKLKNMNDSELTQVNKFIDTFILKWGDNT